jgi:hypothetical protein
MHVTRYLGITQITPVDSRGVVFVKSKYLAIYTSLVWAFLAGTVSTSFVTQLKSSLPDSVALFQPILLHPAPERF